MKKKISRYIILIINLLFLVSSFATAQTTTQENTSEEIPFYNGVSASVDLLGVGSKLFGGNFLSSELGIEANLKNKYFPIIELGYGFTDTTEELYNMHYKSSGPFGRIGLNYRMTAWNKAKSYLYLGLRYGFATFTYDVDGPPFEDGIWGGELPFSYHGIKSNAHWGELLVGVKAQIYKNFSMGWTFRYKARISVKESENTTPWYIPGFGRSTTSGFGFTYNIIYNLPF